jgi:hypothetical protein
MGTSARKRGGRRRRLVVAGAVIALLAIPVTMVFGSHTFPDVATNAFYHDSVDAIANSGVTVGFPDGTYRPEGRVTRGQMAVFLNKLGALGEGTTPVVDALSTNGIIPEFTSTTLTVSATETSHCETRSNFTGTNDFAVNVQIIDPPGTAPINDFESWVDYAGVNADQFNVCVATESGNLPVGQYVVQVTSLEFIGQELFSSASGASKASRVGGREAHK